MLVSGRPYVFMSLGFVAGVAVCAGVVLATDAQPFVTPSHRVYTVSIDEVKQNFVVADSFSGQYTHSVVMSDGSVHDITLRPVNKDGRELVELTDKSKSGSLHSYMGPNGTTTDGNLMVSVKDSAAIHALMEKH